MGRYTDIIPVSAAQVFKWTASSWCEDQDFFRFSGIYRDVYLYTVPEVHVYDLQIRAIPDETLSVAALEIRTNTWGKGTVKITLSVFGKSDLYCTFAPGICSDLKCRCT